jgi:prolyl-tRNA synthetase
VVIVPIMKGKDQLVQLADQANKIASKLRDKGISVKFDDRDTHKPGWKFAEYELKGVPVRIAIGPRDLENGTVEIARRDTFEKQTVQVDEAPEVIFELMDEIQSNIYNKALNFRESHTTEVSTYDEFQDVLENKGGFVLAHWDGSSETEERIKEETKATIRSIPLNAEEEAGSCVYSGKPSKKKVLFARAY